MAFNTFFSDFIASTIIVLRRVLSLVYDPYRTMRKIAAEEDDLQIAVIFLIIFFYYLLVPSLKPEISEPVIQFSIVLFNYIFTVVFIYFFGRILSRQVNVRGLLYLASYALIPTIVWFYLTSGLFFLLPPPRTLSVAGQTFSVVYITISISLLAWKVLLWYLMIRFSTKLQFYEIVFITILYLAVVVPYSFYMYQFGLFRIPFL